jgi:hypothetical protein
MSKKMIGSKHKMTSMADPQGPPPTSSATHPHSLQAVSEVHSSGHVKSAPGTQLYNASSDICSNLSSVYKMQLYSAYVCVVQDWLLLPLSMGKVLQQMAKPRRNPSRERRRKRFSHVPPNGLEVREHPNKVMSPFTCASYV